LSENRRTIDRALQHQNQVYRNVFAMFCVTVLVRIRS
jgi:hypothetical protein